MTNLPKQFDSFNEARQKGFINAKELKESGKRWLSFLYIYSS